MPSVAMKIVVIFEHEIVLAAKALEKFAGKDAQVTKDDVTNALRACYVAIYSPELASGKCPLTVCRNHDLSGI